jgi:hypothetical protein
MCCSKFWWVKQRVFLAAVIVQSCAMCAVRFHDPHQWRSPNPKDSITITGLHDTPVTQPSHCVRSSRETMPLAFEKN